MQSVQPTEVPGLLGGNAGDRCPAGADQDVVALGIHEPRDLRVQFHRVTVVVFALAQGHLLLLEEGDISDGSADAEDLSGLVAHGLIGSDENFRRVAR